MCAYDPKKTLLQCLRCWRARERQVLQDSKPCDLECASCQALRVAADSKKVSSWACWHSAIAEVLTSPSSACNPITSSMLGTLKTRTMEFAAVRCSVFLRPSPSPACQWDKTSPHSASRISTTPRAQFDSAAGWVADDVRGQVRKCVLSCFIAVQTRTEQPTKSAREGLSCPPHERAYTRGLVLYQSHHVT